MTRTRTAGVAIAATVALLLAATVYVTHTASVASASGFQTVAYFDQWGIYGNAYYVKNLDTEGIAGRLTTLIYDFENIDPTNLTCFETIKASDASNESDPNAGDGAGDAWADYQKPFDSSLSVDGSSDTYSQPLKGNFHQLQELKRKYPNLRILVSLGGWTYSKYFSDVAATAASRQKFVSSCIDMFIRGNLPTGIMGDPSGGPGSGAGIFDGFDLDWEYPALLGHLGNHFGPQDTQNFTLLLAEFRNELNALGGQHYLVTAAVPSGQDKIAKIQTGQVGQYLDFADVMTYDMHGAWEASGPTNFQSPLHDSPNDPSTPIRYNIDTSINTWVSGGFPAGKLVMGIPFYARGWSGVPAGSTNGLYQPASGASQAFSFTQTPGVADYKELEAAGLLAPGNMHFDSITDSAWSYANGSFYTLDTPQSIAVKDQYIRDHGLGGAMMFSLDADDASTTLLSAVVGGLQGSGPPPTPTPSGPPPTPTPTPAATPTPTPTPTPTTGGCAAAWSASQVYVGGNQASYNGDNWTAKWWTQGDVPGGQAGVWQDGGSCAGGGPTPSPTPTGTCAPAWSASQVYVGGNEASYHGHNWTAKWWTQGDVPGGTVGVWADDGGCA